MAVVGKASPEWNPTFDVASSETAWWDVQLVFCATLCAVSSSENRVAIDALKCVENNVCVKGIGSCIVHETEATRTLHR